MTAKADKVSIAQAVEENAAVGCTLADCARAVGLSKRTVQRRFRKEFNRGAGRCKVSVKKALHKAAMKGNVQAGIVLLKVMGENPDKPQKNQGVQRVILVYEDGNPVKVSAPDAAPALGVVGRGEIQGSGSGAA